MVSFGLGNQIVEIFEMAMVSGKTDSIFKNSPGKVHGIIRSG
jgi:hypothetical protein